MDVAPALPPLAAAIIHFFDLPGMNQTAPCTLTPQSSTPVRSTRTPNWSLKRSAIKRLYKKEKVRSSPVTGVQSRIKSQICSSMRGSTSREAGRCSSPVKQIQLPGCCSNRCSFWV